jgi:hypothetical protein
MTGLAFGWSCLGFLQLVSKIEIKIMMQSIFKLLKLLAK